MHDRLISEEYQQGKRTFIFMLIDEYMHKVIKLFQSGKATSQQWSDMARAVLDAAESRDTRDWNVDSIDSEIMKFEKEYRIQEDDGSD